MKAKIITALIITLIVSLGAYILWFHFILSLPLSKSPEVWGQFGSYMAGTAGITFAFATVWMLADTLRLQRKELKLTRVEMNRSANALNEQVLLNAQSLHIQRSYYFIKSIEENLNKEYNFLSTIHDQNEFNDQLFSNGNARIRLVSFLDQYMLLMHYKMKQKSNEEKEAIRILITPMTYKYKNIINSADQLGYLNKYNEEIKSEVLLDISFEDITFEKGY